MIGRDNNDIISRFIQQVCCTQAGATAHDTVGPPPPPHPGRPTHHRQRPHASQGNKGLTHVGNGVQEGQVGAAHTRVTDPVEEAAHSSEHERGREGGQEATHRQ